MRSAEPTGQDHCQTVLLLLGAVTGLVYPPLGVVFFALGALAILAREDPAER